MKTIQCNNLYAFDGHTCLSCKHCLKMTRKTKGNWFVMPEQRFSFRCDMNPDKELFWSEEDPIGWLFNVPENCCRLVEIYGSLQTFKI